MYKKIIWLIIIGANFNLIAQEENSEAIQVAEHISDGRLSEPHEQFIEKIRTQLQIKPAPHIRRSSGKMRELNSIFKYVGSLSEYNYIYINEDWFNSLTESERTFVIAEQLLDLDYKHHTFRASTVASLSIPTLQLITAGSLYYATAIRNKMSKKVAIPLALASSLPLQFLSKPIKKKIEENIRLSRDAFIVDKLNCQDGAISFLKKIKEELTTNQESAKNSFKSYYDLIEKRVKTLETKSIDKNSSVVK